MMKKIIKTTPRSDRIITTRKEFAGLSLNDQLRTAKSRKSYFTKEQYSIITRAYDCLNNPSFYEQLGYNPKEEISKAEKIIQSFIRG